MIFAIVALPSADASSGIDVSASNVVAEVGGASSFTVRLSSAPSETVYVALITASGGVAGLTLGDSSSTPADGGEPGRRVVLRFTTSNWNVAQTATVHAIAAGATTVMVVRYDPSDLSTALVARVAVEIEPRQPTLGEVFVASMVDAIQRTEQSIGAHTSPLFDAVVGGSATPNLPAQGQQQEELQQLTGTSVVYVVDDSGSMDSDWPEVQTALAAVRDMTGVTDTKVALIAFGSVPTQLFGLTDHASAPWNTTLSGYADHQTYLNSLNPITAFGGYKGGTYYVPALTAAKTLLDADTTAATKKIVFMTDGQNDDPRDDDGAPDLTGIVVDTVYFGNHFTDNVDDLMTIATETSGMYRAVAKPATGTTNTPPVTAQALDTILKSKALADTTTLYLFDVSFSLHPVRRITNDTRFHHMQLAMLEVQKQVAGISNARVGLARFMGKNELTMTITIELDGGPTMMPLNQWQSPYSRRVDYQSGTALVVGAAMDFRGGTGSTDLDNALSSAYDDIRADTVASTTKRVVLITDGITTNKPTTATIAKYDTTGASVCLDVVAVGAHADRVYLKALAEMVTACNSFSVASDPTP